MPRRRLETRQFAVTYHAAGKQRETIDADLLNSCEASVAGQRITGKRARTHQQRSKHRAPVPGLALKTQNERQQIEKQRRDPKQWKWRHIAADLAGSGDHQQGSARGNPQPRNTHTNAGRSAQAAIINVLLRLRERRPAAAPYGKCAAHGEDEEARSPKLRLSSQSQQG